MPHAAYRSSRFAIDRPLRREYADGAATNELGKKTTCRLARRAGSPRITAIEGRPSANCPNSNFIVTFDERGLEEWRSEAVGRPEARTVTSTWHPTLNLLLTVSEPARITTYSYDAQGRPTVQTVTER